jgi:hypothetical protein
MSISDKQLTKDWNIRARKHLLNREIVRVEYMTDKEKEECDWFKRPVMFMLDNGIWCYPSQDDEHNDGGALFMTNKLGCLPVI